MNAICNIKLKALFPLNPSKGVRERGFLQQSRVVLHAYLSAQAALQIHKIPGDTSGCRDLRWARAERLTGRAPG
jgi:hypothetical protein